MDDFPDGYVRWVGQAIERTGGWATDGLLDVERHRDDSGRIQAVRLEGRIEYDDGVEIEAQVIVARTGERKSYRYRMSIVGDLFLHLHKHPGHERDDGGPTHLHLTGYDRRIPTREMDLLEALEYLRRQDPREEGPHLSP